MFNYLIRLEAASSRQVTFLVVWAIDDSHANELGEILGRRTGLLFVSAEDIEQTVERKHPEQRGLGGAG